VVPPSLLILFACSLLPAIAAGRGKLVERLYREVRATAIPGGSEEILLDFAMRQAASKASKVLKEEAGAAAALPSKL
jgi:hypothetical protein